jgi:hypothetical protein
MVLRFRSASKDIMSEVSLRPSVKPLGRHALRFTPCLLVCFQCIVGIKRELTNLTGFQGLPHWGFRRTLFSWPDTPCETPVH